MKKTVTALAVTLALASPAQAGILDWLSSTFGRTELTDQTSSGTYCSANRCTTTVSGWRKKNGKWVFIDNTTRYAAPRNVFGAHVRTDDGAEYQSCPCRDDLERPEPGL